MCVDGWTRDADRVCGCNVNLLALNRHSLKFLMLQLLCIVGEKNKFVTLASPL